MFRDYWFVIMKGIPNVALKLRTPNRNTPMNWIYNRESLNRDKSKPAHELTPGSCTSLRDRQQIPTLYQGITISQRQRVGAPYRKSPQDRSRAHGPMSPWTRLAFNIGLQILPDQVREIKVAETWDTLNQAFPDISVVEASEAAGESERATLPEEAKPISPDRVCKLRVYIWYRARITFSVRRSALSRRTMCPGIVYAQIRGTRCAFLEGAGEGEGIEKADRSGRANRLRHDGTINRARWKTRPASTQECAWCA